jgi:hypothetical protein
VANDLAGGREWEREGVMRILASSQPLGQREGQTLCGQLSVISFTLWVHSWRPK